MAPAARAIGLPSLFRPTATQLTACVERPGIERYQRRRLLMTTLKAGLKRRAVNPTSGYLRFVALWTTLHQPSLNLPKTTYGLAFCAVARGGCAAAETPDHPVRRMLVGGVVLVGQVGRLIAPASCLRNRLATKASEPGIRPDSARACGGRARRLRSPWATRP